MPARWKGFSSSRCNKRWRRRSPPPSSRRPARAWERFCEGVLRRPELADDARFLDNAARVTHRDALDEAIDAVFGNLPMEALVERREFAE